MRGRSGSGALSKLGALLVLAAVFGLLLYGGKLKGWGQGADKSKLTAEVIRSAITKQQELIGSSVKVDVRIEGEDPLEFFGKTFEYPWFQKRFLVEIPVVLDLGTDLDALVVRYDESANTAEVILKNAEIFRVSPVVEEMSITVEKGVFRGKKLPPEAVQRIIEQANEMAKGQIDQEKIDQANESISKAIRGILAPLSIKELTFTLE